MSAANSIILKIGSTFSGEGLLKLQQGIKDANSHVQRGISVTNQLASSMSSLDTSASHCATAATGLIQAFAQGGVAAAAFTAVTMAIQSKIADLRAELEKTKKEAADFEAKLNSSFSEKLNERIQSKIADANKLGTEFERTAKAAASIAAAMDSLHAAEAKGGVLDLQVEKLNATMAETDEGLRKMIAASYDVQIAEENLAIQQEASAAAVETAKRAYLDNQNRVQTINSQINALNDEIFRQKQNAAAIEQADEDKAKVIRDKIKTLESERAKLIEKRTDAETVSSTLEAKYQVELQNASNAQKEKTLAVKQATATVKDLEAAQKAEKEKSEALAREEAKKVAELADQQAHDAKVKEATQQLSDATKRQAEIRSEVADAEAKVKDAEIRLEQAIKEYNSAFTTNRLNEIIAGSKNADNGKWLTSYMADIHKQIPQIAQGAADIAVKEGIANGKIQTVADMEREGNNISREARIELTKAAARQVQEAQRAARLEKMSEKAISKADAEWLKRYKQLEEAKKARAQAVQKAQEELKKAKEDAEKVKKAQIDSAADLKSIRLKLDALGLK